MEINENEIDDEVDMEEIKIARGFDRGIDYSTMKQKLISELEKQYSDLENIDPVVKNFKTKQKKCTSKMIYLTISMIQLRNGSRISEACSAFTLFFLGKCKDDKVVVKIAKSEKCAYKVLHGKQQILKNATKARYRNIIYPRSWCDLDIIGCIRDTHNYLPCIKSDRLEKRVLDYLLINFSCNTHSLRYAFINYMLTEKKYPMNVVSKMVGHTNVNQLVTYTQNKQVDAALEDDI